MADTVNNDKWPIVKFHFLISITGGDGTYAGDIAFQEVSGLDQEVDVVEYRHGDSAIFSTIKIPGLVKTGEVSLKKGMFKADDRLTSLFNAFYDKKSYYSDVAKRLQVTIKLLDELGNPVMQWDLKNAFPKKLTGTDLKSEATELAIESLELAHEGITSTVVAG